jgi:hypothetical protein
VSSIKLFFNSSFYITLRCHMCFWTSTNAVLWYFCGQVIPFSRGSAWEQPPPDLASYLYKNRIVYLGMSLVPSVTELILAEFLYLQYEDADKPIYLYINSTGTTKVNIFIVLSSLHLKISLDILFECPLWIYRNYLIRTD